MKNYRESKKNKYREKGFAAFFVTILVMIVVFATATSIFILTYMEQKITRNIIKSTQAYYTTEAGVEDILLRLTEDMNWSTPYTLKLNGGEATLEISDIIGGARTIISEGNISERIRRIKIVYEISSDKTSFYYGAQVGEGGLLMDDGSVVDGNIFSNGNIEASPNTEITGSIKVSQTGNYIDGLSVGKDAFVDICKNSDITEILTCTDPGNCTASSLETLTEEISPLSLPISQNQIDDWKVDAEEGGVYSGDYIIKAWEEESLGPLKIEGKLIVQDQAKLYVTGTILATEEIIVQNKSRIRLDQNSYGSLSGVVISDGKITLQDSAKGLGSGEEGSYLMFLSTGTDDAIIIQDEFETDILYAQNGWITIQDTVDLRSVTGYGIHLKNNVEVIYEVGLENTSFSSGPQGGWQVASWKETE